MLKSASAMVVGFFCMFVGYMNAAEDLIHLRKSISGLAQMLFGALFFILALRRGQ